MNLVIVFLCSTNVLCFVKVPICFLHFNPSPPPPPAPRKVTKFCAISLANPKLGPFILSQSPVALDP